MKKKKNPKRPKNAAFFLLCFSLIKGGNTLTFGGGGEPQENPSQKTDLNLAPKKKSTPYFGEEVGEKIFNNNTPQTNSNLNKTRGFHN